MESKLLKLPQQQKQKVFICSAHVQQTFWYISLEEKTVLVRKIAMQCVFTVEIS